LWPGLGSVTYKVTTGHERAQAYFDQGLRLSSAFNQGEARRAFRMAQKLDPECAMCFWGEALVLGPNINLPMQEDAVAAACRLRFKPSRRHPGWRPDYRQICAGSPRPINASTSRALLHARSLFTRTWPAPAESAPVPSGQGGL